MYPRGLQNRIEIALKDTPVVLIHGPRQSGKTTLAKAIAEKHSYRYITLDDPTQLSAAQADPVGFIERLKNRVILDEVQRAPELFLPIKVAVDRNRQPGRFILTGSANLLRLPTLPDSLAGRIEIMRLGPLTQLELAYGNMENTMLDRLFGESPLKSDVGARLGATLVELILTGGFPNVISRQTPARRARWYQNYIETLVEKDIRELFELQRPDVVYPLLQTAAARTARLLNTTDIASPFALTRQTVNVYLHHLETLFLIDRLAPWSSNRMSRLVKTPKLHITDTGLACALLGHDSRALSVEREVLGQLVETFVYGELRRQSQWSEDDIRFFHLRDKDGVEVDLVIELNGHNLCGVEVKAGATVKPRDFKGLVRLRDAVGDRFVRGVVLHDGEEILPFGDRLYAVPLRELWSATE